MAREIADEFKVQQMIEQLAEQMLALATEREDAVILGIRTRGAVLAERVREILLRQHGWVPPLGILDITLYRDDLSQLAINPVVRHTEISFDIEGKLILLVDDVLYTGRTIRSAIDEIIDFGRPSAIRLCVLVDRGGRELPIQADCATLTLPVEPDEVVKVMLRESDGDDRIVVALRADVAAGLHRES